MIRNNALVGPEGMRLEIEKCWERLAWIFGAEHSFAKLQFLIVPSDGRGYMARS